jgi:hypothetical protein
MMGWTITMGSSAWDGAKLSELTEEDKEFFRSEIFNTRPAGPCEDCGGFHLRSCPRIRRVTTIGEGQAVGNRLEVEYWEKWDDSEVIYPEDVWDVGSEQPATRPVPEPGTAADGEDGA